MLRYAKRRSSQANVHLESFVARHNGHFVFACAIGVVVSLEKLATAFNNAVHALADSNLLQKALSVNLGLLAQISHAEVQLKKSGRYRGYQKYGGVRKAASRKGQLASTPVARTPRALHVFVPRAYQT